MNTRRDFMQGLGWMTAAAVAAGCLSRRSGVVAGAMQDYEAPPMKRIRVGIIGLGHRGKGAVYRLARIPDVKVAALCDIVLDKIAVQQKALKEAGRPTAAEFTGAEGWKALCDSETVDVVYNTAPWQLHAPVALRAMRNGKHAFVEVPMATTVDDCWEMVETSEATNCHCMMLENACYTEIELLEQYLCRLGMFGELVSGQGCYLHDRRKSVFDDSWWDHWRLKWNEAHRGDMYPTHGLGPVALSMDINRGDVFETLVSLDSGHFGYEVYAKEHFPEGSWQRGIRFQSGDMTVTNIRTARGRLITVKHDVTSPRPKTEGDFVQGTKGAMGDMPYRIIFAGEEPEGGHKWFSREKADEIRQKYMHPLWKAAGEIAKRVGGHGGCDYLMDLRWAYCLQNGLPLDMDVYDGASWSVLTELSERSCRAGGQPQRVPDFTRGAWKTTKPHPIASFDLDKIDLTGVKM